MVFPINIINNKKGFFVLTTVILLSATVLITVVGITLNSIDNINNSADSEKALKAWSTVTACAEYALMELSTTTGGLQGWEYASTTGQALLVGSSTCYIYPIIASGTDRIIRASSTVSEFTRKILVDVATNTPSILINSWEEVVDF